MQLYIDVKESRRDPGSEWGYAMFAAYLFYLTSLFSFSLTIDIRLSETLTRLTTCMQPADMI